MQPYRLHDSHLSFLLFELKRVQLGTSDRDLQLDGRAGQLAEVALPTPADAVAALKEAFARHGLPKILYCDNGPSFSCRLLTLAWARLGVALVHSRPYDSPSRGKIERLFKTVRGSFLSLLPLSTLSRKVRKDSTISIGGSFWEVPAPYIGQRIQIRHPEGKPQQLYLFEENQPVARLRPVPLADNAALEPPLPSALPCKIARRTTHDHHLLPFF